MAELAREASLELAFEHAANAFAERQDRRRHGFGIRPAFVVQGFFDDNLFGPLGLAPAALHRLRDDLGKVVNVVEKDSVDRVHSRVYVARHGEVDEEQAPTLTRLP